MVLEAAGWSGDVRQQNVSAVARNLGSSTPLVGIGFVQSLDDCPRLVGFIVNTYRLGKYRHCDDV